MYRFLLKPKWIALTLIAILLQPAFWELSQWQIRRLHERQARNAIVTHNESEEPVALEEIISTSANGNFLDNSYEWRSVDVVGNWVPAGQVLVRKQSYESNLGFWVVTPFKSTSGLVVLVNRGWVPASGSAQDSPAVSSPPSAITEVLGRIRIVDKRDGAAPSDLPNGQVDRVQPIEILGTEPTVSNAYLEMAASIPESRGPDLQPILAPEISEGPHKSYAIQWGLFALLTLVGWGVLVRKELQELNNQAAS